MIEGSRHHRPRLLPLTIAFLLVGALLVYRFIAIEGTSMSVWLTVALAILTIYFVGRFAIGAYAINHDFPKAYRYDVHPTFAICVPCYNEGHQIQHTLESMVLDYPKDLYEVILVDDGSSDYSPMFIEQGLLFLSRQGVRCRSIYQKNKGKRHAVAAAIRSTRAEFVVLVDSDSVMAHDALSVFARWFVDPAIGGVSAHADVMNGNQNLLTKMQVARYFIAFRLFKAGESLFGAVTCLSGCCSAYRRSLLIDELEDWTNQTFLGKPFVYSDDRSLTNVVLKKGYQTKYAPDAMSWTVVPSTMKSFLKQQMRWKRGWLINGMDTSKFMWKKHPVAAIMFYLSLPVAVLSSATVIYATWNIVLAGNGAAAMHAFQSIVFMTLLYGTIYSAFRKDWMWLYGTAYTILYIVVLVWQLPYGIITIRESGWGTR